MPLKPIYEKAPLKGAIRLPLRPGQLMTEDSQLSLLLTLCQQAKPEDNPILWEGMLRGGALTCAHPDKLPVADMIRQALNGQQEDGSLPRSLMDSLYVMRAAWALYEASADRSVLAAMLQWCGSLAADWAQVVSTDAIRRSPADLMELLIQLYRVTGKKPLLSLMEKLRHDSMNWAGILHTFAVQQPLARITSMKELTKGMADEDSEEGFYTRQALTCHGVSLADGARAALMNATWSGNGQELSAAAAGWEKVSRFHGAVCGGISCDEMLAGNAPSAGVDAAALGAWMEALCAALQQDPNADLWPALALIRANAFPKALADGALHMLQRPNGLAAGCGDKASILLDTGLDRHVLALARLTRGYAALLSHAVTTAADGVSVNLPVSGRCRLQLDGKAVALNLEAADGSMLATVKCKEPAAFRIKVRMPDHISEGNIKVSRGGSAQAGSGVIKEATRTWQDGDTITCSWTDQLYTVQGYHQGVAVYLGNKLMVLPASIGINVAACGEPVLTDGSVQLPVADIAPVKVVKQVPATLPVLPQITGSVRMAELQPYAGQYGIALFPKGSGC